MKTRGGNAGPERGEYTCEDMLNTYERRTSEAWAQEHRNGAIEAAPAAISCAVQTALAGTLGAIDIALLHKVFAVSLEPLPGEPQLWSAGLLALTGVSMIVGYDLHATANPDSRAVRFIRKAVDLCLPLYVLGMGVAVLSIVYLNAGAIFQPLDASRDLFDISASTAAPFLERFLPQFGTLFSIGVGAFSIINVFAAQRLIELARANARKAYRRFAAFREARKANAVIRECHKRASELLREQAALHEELRTLPVTAANEIVSAIHTALTPRVQWIADERQKPEPEPNRLIPHEPRQAVDPVAKRVARLESISVKQVFTAITSNLSGDAK